MSYIMSYWKGKAGTTKEGQFGTCDTDTSQVPDAENCTQTEYESWVALQPAPIQKITQLQTDITAMDFVSLSDAKIKIKNILERIRKGER